MSYDLFQSMQLARVANPGGVGGAGGQLVMANSGWANGTKGTSLTFDLQSHAADDMAILVVYADGNHTISEVGNTNMTELDQWSEGAKNLAIFYKRLTGSDTNPEISIPTSDQMNGALIVVRNVDWTNGPFSTAWDRTSHFGFTSADSTAANEPITTGHSGAGVFLWQFFAANDISSFGAPSGYTLADFNLAIGANRVNARAWDLDAGAAGTKTPGAWTHSTGGGLANSYNITLALKSEDS